MSDTIRVRKVLINLPHEAGRGEELLVPGPVRRSLAGTAP